ncbi:MAG: hypothetical protein ACRD1R_18260 [Acidobacteriota bacterium]
MSKSDEIAGYEQAIRDAEACLKPILRATYLQGYVDALTGCRPALTDREQQFLKDEAGAPDLLLQPDPGEIPEAPHETKLQEAEAYDKVMVINSEGEPLDCLECRRQLYQERSLQTGELRGEEIRCSDECPLDFFSMSEREREAEAGK